MGRQVFPRRILVCLLVFIMALQSVVSAIAAPTPGSTAQWIWDSGTNDANTWMAFRKTVRLDSIPGSVNARIAVDSKYWLYINDELVVFEGGLKRGPNLTDGYVDNVEIAPYLREGENTIAVLAWYFGKSGYSNTSSGQGGFFFEAVSDGVNICSGTDWKVRKFDAYTTSDRPLNYRLPESNLAYNAVTATAMEGWTTGAYDDSGWSNASAYGQEGAAPWGAMHDRPIPLFAYDEDYVLFDLESAETSEIIKASTLWQAPGSEYVIETKFQVQQNAFGVIYGYESGADFNLWQIFCTNSTTPHAGVPYLKPHIRRNNSWIYQEGGPSDANPAIPEVSAEEKFDHWYEMRVVVQDNTAATYVDGHLIDTRAIYNALGAVGFRADAYERGTVDYFRITSLGGEEVYLDYDFQDGLNPFDGGSLSENNFVFAGSSSKDIAHVVVGESATLYALRMPTNFQFTPYFKVNAPQAGMRIDMYTDKTNVADGPAISANYFTKQGVQEYESLGWVNGDVMYFEIPVDIEVLELGYRQSGYAATNDGSFVSDDEFMNTLWIKSRDTLNVTMRDNYMDCPDRERAQWWGDAVNEMQMAFYALSPSANDLARKGIGNILGYVREGSNRIPTFAPAAASEYPELPAQSMAAVYSFHMYYEYTGDDSHFEEAYPKSYNYLMEYAMGSDGVVQHRGGTWNWSDWGSHSDQKLITNGWYYIALDRTIKMGEVLGLDEDHPQISEMRSRMESIAENFDSVFWNSGGFYRTPGVSITDDRGNALAVYAGLVSEDKYPQVRDVLMSVMHSSPYMEKYALEALYLMGYDSDAMSRIKTRYQGMVESDYSTLWEFWDPNSGTQNHAWTGGPLTMMSMYAAGVSPVEAGYEVFRVAPQMGTFKTIDTVVPSVKGDIHVTVNASNNDELILSTTVPAGTTAIVGVPLIGGTGATTIYYGEEAVWTNGEAVENSSITYLDSDKQFAYFETTSAITLKAVRGDVFTLSVDVDDHENFTLYVNEEQVVLPYTDTLIPAMETVSLRFDPKYAEEYAIVDIVGLYTLDEDMSFALEFDVTMAQDYDLFVRTAYVGPENLALNKGVDASHAMSSNDNAQWGANNLTDGIRMSQSGKSGFTTTDWSNPDISATPQTIVIDLDDTAEIEKVYLYPRTDAQTVEGTRPGYPMDFTIQVSEDGDNYITVATLSGEATPENRGEYTFEPVSARYVKIETTLLGMPASDENSVRYRVQLAEIEIYGAGTTVTPVDKSALDALVQDALALDEEHYTPESWEPFANALEEAQDILINSSASQEDVDYAYETLQNAMDALVEIHEPGGKVERVKVNLGSLSTMGKGERQQLTFTVNPDEAEYDEVIWTSSTPTILEVDEDGWVTAIKSGTAIITVSVDGVTSKVTIRVTA